MERSEEIRDSERRQATVLFADISCFTQMSEKMDPEDVTAVMNCCFPRLEEAVRRHGGVVDKYIGDCIMAIFGVPNAIENAPKQALNAAIEMRHRIDEFNRERELHTPLGIHIGINTGLVIAGEIGGRHKRDFTVMGDTVNLASRLKDASADGQIFVGPETHRYTRDEFAYRKLGPLSLKGKERPVDAYELLSTEEHRYRPQIIRSDRMIFSDMVGRDAELREFRELLARVVKGDGLIVSLSGEAGIGKSRLIAEVAAAEEARQITALQGRSLSIGQTLSFHPFVDLLRHWAGITESAGEEEALKRLEEAVGELCADQAGEIFPFIATLMGMRVSGAHAERIRGIAGEAMEKLIFKSTRDLLRRMARLRPLVLVFEDLHWADQSSIQLLESLLRLVVDSRILFVLVFRPDYPETSQRILDAACAQHALQHREIHLRPLDERHCDQLIQNLLQSEDLPHATRALIAQKAEGSPFFIEEVVRSLIDAGAVEAKAGRLRVTEKIESVVIPGTIQEVIMSRVDRLDAPTRHVLQVASVIGRSFYHRILADVMPEDRELDAKLTYLKERQLLLERRTRRTAVMTRRTFAEELEYVFQHALVQETIYESILLQRRRGLHARVAQAIETAFADRLPDFYGMLAYHYSRADELEKAEEYLFKAGEEAARSAASNEALTFFREASRLYLRIHGDGGDPYKKAILERNIGLALMNTGNLTESMEHFDGSLAFLGDPIPSGTWAAVTQFLADFVAVSLRLYLPASVYRPVRGQTRYRDNLEIRYPRIKAQSTSNPTRLVFDYFRAIHWMNRTDPAAVPDQVIGLYSGFAAMFAYSGVSFRVGRRYLDISERLLRPGHVKDRFDHQSLTCICNYLEGKWDDADGVVDPVVVEGALRHGGLWEVNTYLGLDCDRRLRRGDFDAARQRLAELAKLSDAYGFEFANTNHDAQTTLLLLEERQVEAALAAADRYCASVHDDTLCVLALGSKAKAQVLLGDRAGAAATLGRAEQIVKRSSIIPPWHLSAYAVSRLLYDVAALASGRPAQQRSAGRALARRARRSAAFARRVAARVAVQRGEVYRLTARMHWLLGNAKRARRWWLRSIAECEQLGAKPELARTYADIGLSLMAESRERDLAGVDAREYVARAQRLFVDLGLAWDMTQVEAQSRRAA